MNNSDISDILPRGSLPFPFRFGRRYETTFFLFRFEDGGKREKKKENIEQRSQKLGNEAQIEIDLSSPSLLVFIIVPQNSFNAIYFFFLYSILFHVPQWLFPLRLLCGTHCPTIQRGSTYRPRTRFHYRDSQLGTRSTQCSTLFPKPCSTLVQS